MALLNGECAQSCNWFELPCLSQKFLMSSGPKPWDMLSTPSIPRRIRNVLILPLNRPLGASHACQDYTLSVAQPSFMLSPLIISSPRGLSNWHSSVIITTEHIESSIFKLAESVPAMTSYSSILDFHIKVNMCSASPLCRIFLCAVSLMGRQLTAPNKRSGKPPFKLNWSLWQPTMFGN